MINDFSHFCSVGTISIFAKGEFHKALTQYFVAQQPIMQTKSEFQNLIG